MDNKLFLMNGIRANEMQVKKYEQEADLQKIITDNPNLLARSMEDLRHEKSREYGILP